MQKCTFLETAGVDKSLPAAGSSSLSGRYFESSLMADIITISNHNHKHTHDKAKQNGKWQWLSQRAYFVQ